VKADASDAASPSSDRPTTYVGEHPAGEIRAILLVSSTPCPLAKLAEAVHQPQAAVEQARSAEEAGEMIGRCRWDMILLDGLDPGLAAEVLIPLLATAESEPPKVLVVVGGRIDRPATWKTVQISNSSSRPPDGSRSDLVRRFALTHRLSQREREVIDLAATGLATKEIAARLGCSQQTVAVYWSRIYRKLDCHSHAEVMARLLATALRDAC
jgi:DNA-binding CsgD family transcriptional regulator